MIEYRYGILSQLISEIDNYYQKTFAQFQKEALDLAKQNSSGDFEIYYIRFTPDNGFWKSSLRKESGCSVLAMRDQLTWGWKADISSASFMLPPGLGIQYAFTVQPKAGRSENIYYFAK